VSSASVCPVAITTIRRGGAGIVVTPPKWVIVRGKTPSASGAPIPGGIDIGPGGVDSGGSPAGDGLAHPPRATSAASIVATTARTDTDTS
jgi:hypothetical protein